MIILRKLETYWVGLYAFNGKVVYGQQLGRSLGVPTANLWLPRIDFQCLASI